MSPSRRGFFGPAFLNLILVPFAALGCGGSSLGVTEASTASEGSSVSLTIAPSAVNLFVGQTMQLRAEGVTTARGPVGPGGPAWASSDPRVVTVSSTGLVTGLTIGSAVITVSWVGRTASAPVAVR